MLRLGGVIDGVLAFRAEGGRVTGLYYVRNHSTQTRDQRVRPIPKRWVVERTYGWLMLPAAWPATTKACPHRSGAMIHIAMTDLMARRLTGENTISWRDPTPHTKRQIPG